MDGHVCAGMNNHQLETFLVGLSKTFLLVAKAIVSVRDFRDALRQAGRQALCEVTQALQGQVLRALPKPAPKPHTGLSLLFSGPGDGARQLPISRQPVKFSAN